MSRSAGAAKGTGNLLVANQALSQLSYSPDPPTPGQAAGLAGASGGSPP